MEEVFRILHKLGPCCLCRLCACRTGCHIKADAKHWLCSPVPAPHLTVRRYLFPLGSVNSMSSGLTELLRFFFFFFLSSLSSLLSSSSSLSLMKGHQPLMRLFRKMEKRGVAFSLAILMVHCSEVLAALTMSCSFSSMEPADTGKRRSHGKTLRSAPHDTWLSLPHSKLPRVGPSCCNDLAEPCTFTDGEHVLLLKKGLAQELETKRQKPQVSSHFC